MKDYEWFDLTREELVSHYRMAQNNRRAMSGAKFSVSLLLVALGITEQREVSYCLTTSRLYELANQNPIVMQAMIEVFDGTKNYFNLDWRRSETWHRLSLALSDIYFKQRKQLEAA